MGAHPRILPKVPAQLSRRAWLSAFAPPAGLAWRGNPVAAAYSSRLRQTRIWFERDNVVYAGLFDHDRAWVNQPSPASRPEAFPPSQPRIRLRAEFGWLVAADDRRILRRLMPLDPAHAPVIVYPHLAHPDLTALWALQGLLFFTNNDYHNVYRLPDSMLSAWQKPTRR